MTTLTSKHSPTPWIATTEKDKDGFVQVLTNEKSPFGDIWAVAYEVTPENAAFIVQAVNSFDAREAEIAKLRDAHKALVKALNKAKQCVDILWNETKGTEREGTAMTCVDAKEYIKATLKLAKEV